jgi:hypothetical protein
MNHFMGFCIKRPITVLLILAAMTFILAPGMLKLKIDNSIETIMPKNDSEYLFYNQIKETYGDNGQFIVMAISAKDLFSPDTLQKLDDLVADLEEYKYFDKKKESSRMERFRLLSSHETVNATELLDYFSDDPPFQRTLKRKIRTLFGDRESLGRRELKKLGKSLHATYELKQLKLIDDIISPLTTKDIKGENDTLESYDLVDSDRDGRRIMPSTQEAIDLFRQRLERNPAFELVLYTRDPETRAITDFGLMIKFINIEDRDPITRDLMEITDTQDSLKIVYTGMPIVYVWAVNFIRLDSIILVPLIMIVIMIVFYLNFRSFRGVWLPILSLGIAESWVLGLMGYLGFHITVMASSIPSLMIAIGSSYSIHILNQYYIDFDMISERGKKEGLLISMTHITLTVLLAGLTTIIAFMTLCTSQLSAVREWGIFCGIGALFAVFISSALIPACLMLLPHRMPVSLRRKKENLGVHLTLVEKALAYCIKFSTHHYRLVVSATAIVAVISITGLIQLKVDTAYVSYFKKDSEIRKNVDIIGQKFGGGWGFDILVDSGKPDGVKSPEFLKAVTEFREWLTAEENADLRIGHTGCFSDIIKTMNMAMDNDRSVSYCIPGCASDICDFIEIYTGEDKDSDGRFDDFEPFVDADYRTCNVLARLCRKEGQLIGTSEVQKIVKKIGEFLTQHLPEGMTYHISGFPVMEVQVSRYLVIGQLQNMLLSLIAVVLICMLLFSHFSAGLLALIPLTVAVLINFGIMGWFNIALDMTTSVIAAVTIGIGIDDTIHFMNSFRHNRARGYSIDESIDRTLNVSGKAIIFTSVALIFGFLVFLLSQFIPLNLLGILLAITMTATTLGALLVLPAFIKITHVNLNPPLKETWMSKYFNLSRWFGLNDVE